jgi:hypothetical protein
MDSRKGRFIGATLASAYFIYYVVTAREWHFIDTVNLIFHEAGHTIFSFFGEFTHVLMGSGFQVLLPLSIALYFFYTGQRLSGAITLMWVGQNLINVSIYAGDSIAMQLPLLGGDSSTHDWHYLLTTTHLLNETPQVAATIYGLGIFTISLGIALAFYFVFNDPDSTARPIPY